VFGLASRGRESAGVGIAECNWRRASGTAVPGAAERDTSVARAFQPEHIADSEVGRGVLVCGECGPLTPDPSPPFHGGEG